MYGNLEHGTITAQGARYALNTPLANTWQQYTVPLVGPRRRERDQLHRLRHPGRRRFA